MAELSISAEEHEISLQLYKTEEDQAITHSRTPIVVEMDDGSGPGWQIYLNLVEAAELRDHLTILLEELS